MNKHEAFRTIIGYDAIKEELTQIVEMEHSKERFDALGAKRPRGILFDGPPGVGKTLFATALGKALERPVYSVRKDAADMLKKLEEVFRTATASQPSVVLLDDLDKFTSAKCSNSNEAEYVAIQSWLDNIRGTDVLVVATVNSRDVLPESLLRPGRFDRIVSISPPSKADAEKLVGHYLEGKPVADDVSPSDIARALSSCSCAEIENSFNEAAINAGTRANAKIDKSDFKEALLRRHYCGPDYTVKRSPDELHATAVHEAGHIVAAECLCPGSVGMASIRGGGHDSLNGYVHTCRDLDTETSICVSLAGATAMERFGCLGEGCESDLKRAARELMSLMQSGVFGISLFNVSEAASQHYFPELLDGPAADAQLHALLEVYLGKVRKLLAENSEFLGQIVQALEREQTLFYSDIQLISEKCLTYSAK